MLLMRVDVVYGHLSLIGSEAKRYMDNVNARSQQESLSEGANLTRYFRALPSGTSGSLRWLSAYL
ncbi:hypothetical protein D9M70_371260 [compost metagenome]